MQKMKKIRDADLRRDITRHEQLERAFDIKLIEPECTDEYIKIPIDLPWDELAADVPAAFEKFGWYGMVHRMSSDWKRSEMYGGLGLTYNPDYIFDIPKHAQGWGQPRSSNDNFNSEDWLKACENYDYENIINNKSPFDSYDDPFGLKNPTPVCSFGSFPKIFEKFKRPLFQGRIAELKARDYGAESTYEKKAMTWHTDEPNHLVARVLIPLVWDENYFIEFKETGTKLYFEKGYAYYFDTYKVHRFNFDYNPNMVNRTCMIIGWSPYLNFDGEYWTVNEYVNKVHPKDMILKGLVV